MHSLFTRGWRGARIVAGIALVASASIGLVGCSSGGGGSSSTASKTLTVWHYYSLDNQKALLSGYASTFEKAHPGITVNNVYVPQAQLNAKLTAAAGTKSGPDVVVFDGYSATTLAAAGALAPITKDWSSFAGASDFASGAVTKVDGKVYAAQGYVNTLALYYNKDILSKIGVQPPTTVPELESDMAKAKAAGYQGITMAGQPNLQGAFQAFPWVTDAGFDYANPSASALSTGFSTVRSWVQKGYLSPEVATWDQNIPFSKFTAGGVAFAENGNWQLSAIKTAAKFKYGVVPLPVGSTGKIYLGGEAEAVGAFSKNPTLASQYLESTFWSQAGQLQALKEVGSLPTRSDASSDSSISSDPYLSQFAKAISTQGSPFPDLAIPAKNINTVYQDNGVAWSAALSGSQSPSAAAASFLGQLTPLLSK